MKLKGVQFKTGVRFDGEAREMVSPQNPRLAGIEIDLTDKGPLYLYLQERRSVAKTALSALVETDPHDGIAVARAQAAVQEYLKVCAWIAGRIDDAARADDIIKEDYSDRDQADPDAQE